MWIRAEAGAIRGLSRGGDGLQQQVARRRPRLSLQLQHDEIVRQIPRRNASEATIDERLHLLMMRIDAPETERAAAAGRMPHRLLQPVVLRQRKNAVISAPTVAANFPYAEKSSVQRTESGSMTSPRPSTT